MPNKWLLEELMRLDGVRKEKRDRGSVNWPLDFWLGKLS